MEKINAWTVYDEGQLAELEKLNAEYMDFLSRGKTERECAKIAVGMAEAAGYRNLDDIIAKGESLKAGDKVQLMGFGTFEIKDRPARTGRNPATGESIEIAASKTPVFKAGKNDGKLKKLGDLRIVSQDGDYKLIYAVLAVCALAIVAALAVSSIAYYGLWVLAIGTFLLAVYYTVKMM